MPYKNREQQLQYMRTYMKLKRAIKTLQRLKARKQQLQAEYEENPALQRLLLKEEVGIVIDDHIINCQTRIQHLEGLLQISQK